jgi:hypothetical protein
MPQAALTESLDRVRLRAARGGKYRMHHHTFLILQEYVSTGWHICQSFHF